MTSRIFDIKVFKIEGFSEIKLTGTIIDSDLDEWSPTTVIKEEPFVMENDEQRSADEAKMDQ